ARAQDAGGRSPRAVFRAPIQICGRVERRSGCRAEARGVPPISEDRLGYGRRPDFTVSRFRPARIMNAKTKALPVLTDETVPRAKAPIGSALRRRETGDII